MHARMRAHTRVHVFRDVPEETVLKENLGVWERETDSMEWETWF